MARSTHVHQAALPGRYVTLVVTTRWQYGQLTTPGTSLRYGSEIGTGCGCVTTAGWVCLLLTDGVTPTEAYRGQRKDRGRYQEQNEKLIEYYFLLALLVWVHAVKSSSKDVVCILCVIGWIMIPVFCEGDVTAVGNLGGVRIGKGSVVTRKKEEIS